MPHKNVAEGLAILFEEKVIGFDTILEVTQSLSKKGATRIEIMDFFYLFTRNYATRLTDEQLDIVGDVNIHLSGQQCRIDQIIRLPGDPEGTHELASFVREQVKNWAPPER